MTKTIQSAKNVLDVLAALSGHFEHGLTPTDLCKATGFSPSNITRYVATLEEKGFATRIPETGRIRQAKWAANAPLPQDTFAEEVKAAFYAKGLTIAEWAKANGYDRHYVYSVLNGQIKAHRGKGYEIKAHLADWLKREGFACGKCADVGAFRGVA